MTLPVFRGRVRVTPRFLSHLILGARSGKSRYALDLARGATGPVVFVATAEARDGDMARPHRAAPCRAPRPVADDRGTARPRRRLPQGGRGAEVVLVDCVTLWIANRLLAAHRDAAMLGTRAPSLVG